MIKHACDRPPARIMNAREALVTFQRALAERIGQRKYQLWFEESAQTQLVDSEGTGEEGAEIRLTAPSAFAADWIDRNFRSAMTEIGQSVLGSPVRITIASTPVADCAVEAERSVIQTRGVRMLANGTVAPAHTAREGSERGWKRFDDFLVGPPNRLAYESARQMAEAQADPLRLLYLHGSCGVGKSHLLQSICRRYRELHPNARVRYVTGEQFTNEYIAAIREGLIEGFRRRTRKLDLLVIDDVHFLGNKTATQSECLHTIDAIGFQGSRVVLASDEHPRQIAKCSAGLVSRFLSGMVVKVDDPDRQTRLALALRFARQRGLDLSPIALETLVDRSGTSIRELEGSVMTIAALQALSAPDAGNGRILVERALGRGNTSHAGRPVRIGEIIQAVCAVLGIEREDLLGVGRHRRVVCARGLASHLAREMTTLSFPEIARALGRSSHSTIHAAATRFGAMIERGEIIPTRDENMRAADAVERTRREVFRVKQ